MIRIVLSICLGFLATVAFMVGGALFENQGQWETRAGLVAIALYCAACQFFLPRKRSAAFPANWPIVIGLIGMVGSLLAVCVKMVQGGFSQSWPQFVSGSVAALAGALLAARRPPKVAPAPSTRANS